MMTPGICCCRDEVGILSLGDISQSSPDAVFDRVGQERLGPSLKRFGALAPAREGRANLLCPLLRRSFEDGHRLDRTSCPFPGVDGTYALNERTFATPLIRPVQRFYW